MVDFSDYHYVPILGVRPSEMTALEELRPADQAGILPLIVLRPWATANHFESVLARIEAARGNRPIIADISSEDFDLLRPVHHTIDSLRDPTNGYANYCRLVEENENFVPILQIASPREIARQAGRLMQLERGCVVRLTEPTFRFSREIAAIMSNAPDDSKIHFIIDFERQSRDILARAAGAIGIAEGVRSELPNSFISVSASSFPDSFVGITRQEIFERRFFDEVVRQIGNRHVIYSDRGSVRAEAMGGGGQPAPRIDNALPTNWQFFRIDEPDDRDSGYQQAATDAVASPDWSDLGIWGTEQIAQTAAGRATIGSPARSTAVRINIHLHRQSNFDAPPIGEDDWSD